MATATFHVSKAETEAERKPIVTYEVITDAQNTGLDGEVFATKQEAEQAVATCKAVFGQSKFEIVETAKPATITFDSWDARGW